MPLLMYVFSPDCGEFGRRTHASSPTRLPSDSVIMDGALAGWSFTGKCEGDAWTQDKREFVNMLVFGEILLQIALKNVGREKKDRQKERVREEKSSWKSKQKLQLRLDGFVSLINLMTQGVSLNIATIFKI